MHIIIGQVDFSFAYDLIIFCIIISHWWTKMFFIIIIHLHTFIMREEKKNRNLLFVENILKVDNLILSPKA